MTTGRMPEGNHSGKIKLIVRGEFAQIVDRMGNVQKGAGPAAAGVAKPAVLDIPCCYADAAQRFTQRPVIIQTVCRAVVTAMDADYHGMGRRCRGQAQVAELVFVGAVMQAGVGRR